MYRPSAADLTNERHGILNQNLLLGVKHDPLFMCALHVVLKADLYLLFYSQICYRCRNVLGRSTTHRIRLLFPCISSLITNRGSSIMSLYRSFSIQRIKRIFVITTAVLLLWTGLSSYATYTLNSLILMLKGREWMN